MNIVEWYNTEHTVLHWIFPKTWTEDEYEKAFEKAMNMTQAITHDITVIADLSNSETIPLQSVFYFEKAAKILPDNVENITIVGANRYITFMVKTFSRLYRSLGAKITLVETLEDIMEMPKKV